MTMLTIPITVDQALQLCRDPDTEVELVAEAPGIALTLYVATRLQQPIGDQPGGADPPPAVEAVGPGRGRAGRRRERLPSLRPHLRRTERPVDPRRPRARRQDQAGGQGPPESQAEDRRSSEEDDGGPDRRHVRVQRLRAHVRQPAEARRASPASASEPADRRPACSVDVGAC